MGPKRTIAGSKIHDDSSAAPAGKIYVAGGPSFVKYNGIEQRPVKTGYGRIRNISKLGAGNSIVCCRVICIYLKPRLCKCGMTGILEYDSIPEKNTEF
jgi:hypothetical protein